ncbi:recombination protein RecO [Sulfurovum sp. XTW-4]|uniref:Recombination protein RecO n=1 Tax=Sulfurovum xiamenensis TaxID=3019066 RepID=A0ABT7QU54_9BACT|nr:recombination protein RecO [Sulfurovum xiamenensis]MDM5264551.1 recombination protein RecO [Sulfurovum xiamenensis]
MLSVRKAKNEDTIALVLSPTEVRTYYRFFGARHSILQLGNLIDFEVEGEGGSFLPRLRSLSHMGFPWLFDKNRLLLWHNFIKRFEPHLKDAEEIDSFYFDLLLSAAQKWDKQNPKRIVCESYITLLEYEGRLHHDEHCYICENRIEEEIALMQSFIPAHPACLYTAALPTKKVLDFFKTKKTVFLEDHEVDYLFEIVMKGL